MLDLPISSQLLKSGKTIKLFLLIQVATTEKDFYKTLGAIASLNRSSLNW